MHDEIIRKAEQLLNLCDKANSKYIKFYLNSLFLTWRWWLCLILIVTSWTLWWFKFRNKESTISLLFIFLIIFLEKN